MKKCFKCGIEKDLSDFYKHKQMADGHLNKCKKCTVTDAKKQTEKITSTPEGLEKERDRHRKKYARLGYKEKQIKWNEKRPWVKSAVYKNLHRNFKVPKGVDIHHWNYEMPLDFFLLNVSNHKKAHNILKINNMIFEDLDGNLLDSREKHLKYLTDKGIIFYVDKE